jgi:hypothetical protein
LAGPTLLRTLDRRGWNAISAADAAASTHPNGRHRLGYGG